MKPQKRGDDLLITGSYWFVNTNMPTDKAKSIPADVTKLTAMAIGFSNGTAVKVTTVSVSPNFPIFSGMVIFPMPAICFGIWGMFRS